MADLDDFFAKRDKKKSKKKFDTAEDLAKVLDQKVKEKKRLETGKSSYLPEGGRQSPGPGLPAGDDDEWIEAEEKQPDFSNLKIQELVLSSDDEDDPSQEGKVDEEGGNEGPWNKKSKSKNKDKEKDSEEDKEKESPKEESSEEVKETSESKPEGEDSEEGSKESKDDAKQEAEPKKYVPPSMRNKPEGASAPSPGPPKPAAAPPAAGGGGTYVPPSRRATPAAGSGSALAPMKKKGALPTLEDEESFPSLS